MPKFDSPLDNINVASPCPADWNEMYGDDRKRFCSDCKLTVYNLSGMTRQEAENLVTNAEGRLCVRFFRRTDGTVITRDCPVGWARVKQRARLAVTAVFSMLMALVSGVIVVSFFSKQKATVGEMRVPFATPTPQPLMGAVAVTPNVNSNTAPHRNANAVQGNIAVDAPKAGQSQPSRFEIGKMRAVRNAAGDGLDG